MDSAQHNIPSHILRGAEAAADEGVLDDADGGRVVRLPESEPFLREQAGRDGGSQLRAVDRCEGDGEGKLGEVGE
jgi:hypothetical protein